METSENDLKIEIGKRIEYIRLQKHMSKDKLATLIGVSGQHLGKVIYGESGLSVEKIVELSIKTGYPTDFILLGKGLNFETNIRDLLIQVKNATEATYKNLETLESLVS